MSDTAVNTYPLPAAAPQEAKPSFAKGLLWGGALSAVLWMVIGWMFVRAL